MDKHTRQEERKLDLPGEKRTETVRSRKSPDRGALYITAGASLFEMPPGDLKELASRTGNSLLLDLMGGAEAPVTNFSPLFQPDGGDVNPIHAGPITLCRFSPPSAGGTQATFPVGGIRDRSSGAAGV